MKLKLIYDAESDVPEPYKELYTEKDGKWVLTGVDGLKTQTDIDALKEVADKERGLRREAEAKVKKFEKLGDRDVDEILSSLDEVDALKERLKAGEGGDKETAQKLQEATVELNKLRRDFEGVVKERDEYKETSEQLGGKIRKTTLESALTKVANEAKVRPEAIEDVLLYQHLFEVGEDGSTITTKDGVGVTPGLDPKLWLDDMQNKRPHWWEGAVGGGSQGNNGNNLAGANPFNPKTANISKISELMKTDPAKAQQYAKAAGFDSPEAGAAAIGRAAAGAPPK